MIDLVVSVIEPEFTPFEVQVEGLLVHAAELRQAAFREAPEALDAVDGHAPAHELIAPTSDFEVPAVPTPTRPSVMAFEKAEDGGFAEGAAPAIAPPAARADGGFIHFNFSAHRLDLIAVPSHAPAQRGQMTVDGHTAEPGHKAAVQAEREQPAQCGEIAPLRFGNGNYTV